MNKELESILTDLISEQKTILAKLEARLNDLQNPVVKYSAAKWCEITGITVLDPDGWDRSDPNFIKNWYNHPIDFTEFKERQQQSTCSYR